MDKLKPVIEHHFWIVCLIVLILPLVGWWPAVGQFKTETEKKISDIDSAFSQVPASGQPNDRWAKSVNEVSGKIEEKVEQQKYELWRRQEQMMTWPNRIIPELRPKEYLAEIPIRALEIYKNGYDIDVKNVWKEADSFDYSTGEGTVLFPMQLMPQEKFGDIPPTSDEIWAAQEDLWLLTSLLKSIHQANSDSTVLIESLVRSIDVLELVGGGGDYPASESSSAGTPEYGTEMSEAAYEDMMMESDFAREQDMTVSSASFDPADEFGKEEGRYIDYTEGELFKKRGFYLEAVIEHQRLPDLLVELSNGDWPVTITRVQMSQAWGSNNSLLPGGNYGGFPESGEFPAGGGANPYDASIPDTNTRPSDQLYNGERTAESAEASALAKKAVSGPELAQVAISGVIYIYNPVEPPESLTDPTSTEAETTTADPSAPATSDPETAPDTPDEPVATDSIPEIPESPETPGESDNASTTESSNPELPGLD